MRMVYEIELAIFGASVGIATPISVYLAKKLIEPVFGLRELIGEIAYSMNYYANIYSNPGMSPNHQKVSTILRQLASKLVSKLYLVKYPSVPATFGLTPSIQDTVTASRELIGISNMLFSAQNVQAIYKSSEEIKKRLRI
jgi:hypothetical protein